jgi:hypothetical protein
MRSLAEPGRGSVRRAFEGAAHVLALGLLLWLFLDALRGAAAGPAESLGVRTLPSALSRWSTVAAPERVHLTLDGDLGPTAVDWLAALNRAGTPVHWDAGRATPIAAVAEPMVDPGGGTRIRIGADGRATVTLTDRYGPLDSITAGRTGATFLARSGPTWISASTGMLAARATVADSLVLGRVLLLGQVGWESKFVAAALEERGWKVDARLHLSPKGNIFQGLPSKLDTSRYAVVMVLDSVTTESLAGLPAFVRSGGGAILTAAATRAPGLRGLARAMSAAAVAAVEPFDTAGSAPRRSLGLVPIAELPGQVVLERQSGGTALAARRMERGRLLTVGYQDTWRWRMSGAGDAVEAHRTWWADLVGAVAHVGRIPRAPSGASVDEAPFAHLVDRLGPASPASAPAFVRHIPRGVIFGLMAGLVVLGWASRRLRGAA